MTTATLNFDFAAKLYKAAPSADTLLALNKAALPLIDPTPVSRPWQSVNDPGAFLTDWQEIRVVCDRRLDDEEIRRLSGCLGYALRAELAGEDLSDPTVQYAAATSGHTVFTVLEFSYDATKSRRSNPDYAYAFERAHEMVFTGTPMRLTNRAGAGTFGTRLVEGVSYGNVSLYVR